jgi:hypothetical protein
LVIPAAWRVEKGHLAEVIFTFLEWQAFYLEIITGIAAYVSGSKRCKNPIRNPRYRRDP